MNPDAGIKDGRTTSHNSLTSPTCSSLPANLTIVSPIRPTVQQKQLSSKHKLIPMDENAPCPACSWTAEQQSHCDYKSHVKLFEGASDQGFWSLGSKYVLKETSSKRQTQEADTLRFVQRNTTIPLPAVVAAWTEPADGAQFLLTARLPGTPLSDAWPRMSDAAKRRAAQQVAALLQQLRTLHAPRIQNAAGGALYAGHLFADAANVAYGPLASDAHLWAQLDQRLAAEGAPLAARSRLGARLPPAGPYTFSHGGLYIDDVMVDDEAAGNVTGLQGWEFSGFFPVWYEYVVSMTNGMSQDDADWKRLLRGFMEPCSEAAVEFWLDYLALTGHEQLAERRAALLRESGDE